MVVVIITEGGGSQATPQFKDWPSSHVDEWVDGANTGFYLMRPLFVSHLKPKFKADLF